MVTKPKDEASPPPADDAKPAAAAEPAPKTLEQRVARIEVILRSIGHDV